MIFEITDNAFHLCFFPILCLKDIKSCKLIFSLLPALWFINFEITDNLFIFYFFFFLIFSNSFKQFLQMYLFPFSF